MSSAKGSSGDYNQTPQASITKKTNPSVTNQGNDSKSSSPLKGSIVGGGGGLKEGLVGTGCGILYGATSPLVGHPLDSIKTKMQAQTKYMQGGFLYTTKSIYKQEGIRGFWRGLIPPLMGSSVFRSIQFGAYGFAYGYMKQFDFLTQEIPYTGGLQSRVVLAGLFSASCRSLIETPLELMKVRRQTGQSWRVGQSPLTTVQGWKEILSPSQCREVFKGFGITFFRTWGLMGSFFLFVDYAVRHIPDVINAPLIGPFIKGGVVSTMAWLLVWPLETLKSQVQANTQQGLTTASGTPVHQLPILKRLSFLFRHQGVRGVYRGALPGCMRSLFANGCSMIVYTYCQSMREKFESKNQFSSSSQVVNGSSIGPLKQPSNKM